MNERGPYLDIPSAQSSENVVSENQVVNENHGLPPEAGAFRPARSARPASSAPTSAGSFVRTEVNAATASGSSGGAGSPAVSLSNVWRR